MDLNTFLKENPDISISVKGTDLLEFAKEIVQNTTQQILEKHSEKLYTRTEIIDKFKISPATLWRWEKAELITSKKIGNKKYFPASEIQKLQQS